MTLDLYVCSFSLRSPFDADRAVSLLRTASLYADQELGEKRVNVEEKNPSRLFSQGRMVYDDLGIVATYRVGVRSKISISASNDHERRMQFDFAQRTTQPINQQRELARILGEEFVYRGCRLIPDCVSYDHSDPFEGFRRYEVLSMQKQLPSWLASLGWRLVPLLNKDERSKLGLEEDTIELERNYLLLPFSVSVFENNRDLENADRAFAEFVFDSSQPTILDLIGNKHPISSLSLSEEGLHLFLPNGSAYTLHPFHDAAEELLLRLSSHKLDSVRGLRIEERFDA